MKSLVLVLVLLVSFGAFGQTTSTMCQASEVALDATVVERKLVGCGEGFPDNLLWHLDRADSVDGTLDGKVTRKLTGRGAVIYFIDTGVMAAHQEFARAAGSSVIAGLDYGPDPSCPQAPTAPCVYTVSGILVHGHGTGAASVAIGRNTGIAPDALVVAAMTTDDPLRFTNMLKKIAAHAHAPTTPAFRTGIINLSGAITLSDPKRPEVDEMVRRMTTGVDANGNADPNGKMFLFVTIGGNAYRGQPYNQCGPNDEVVMYPAILGPSIDGLVTVGGIDRENHYWSGACKGWAIEVAAPAPDMFVASISSNDAYRYKPEAGTSGTSWSAPYVSGIAALLLELNPNRTPAQLEALLKASPSRVEGIPVPILPEPPTGKKRRSVR